MSKKRPYYVKDTADRLLRQRRDTRRVVPRVKSKRIISHPVGYATASLLEKKIRPAPPPDQLWASTIFLFTTSNCQRLE
jgi:hypothetical protein